jgi:predicted methyltransferase MtxX (methanogen marker protein 4)
LRRLEKVLKVTVFREDIIERLIDNIVRGCVDEGGVLIDLRGGRLIKPNRSTDVTALVDLK